MDSQVLLSIRQSAGDQFEAAVALFVVEINNSYQEWRKRDQKDSFMGVLRLAGDIDRVEMQAFDLKVFHFAQILRTRLHRFGHLPERDIVMYELKVDIGGEPLFILKEAAEKAGLSSKGDRFK